ncbi:MAG: hypothetical protein GY764_09980 [Halieaceae bacterium]|nr:hypothetical protein [Halieaceae bacterium]
MAKNLNYRAGAADPISFAQVDDNFDALMHYSGVWAAGTYTRNEVVKYQGGVYVCTAASTIETPYEGLLTDWDLIGTTPGRGAMNLETPYAGSDITATYQPIIFDTDYGFEVGLETTPATGEFKILHPGLWTISLLISIDHNESNSGRSVRVRLRNVTKGISGSGASVPIGRNQPGTLLSFSLPAQVTLDGVNAAGGLGDSFRWELGGGDTVTDVFWDSAETSLVQSSAV